MKTTKTEEQKKECQLVRKYKGEIESSERHIKAAKENLVFIEQLPDFIKEIDEWYYLYKYSNKWSLETYGLDKEKATKILNAFKLNGLMNVKSRFENYNGRWKYTGEIMINDNLLEVVIDGGEKPASCRVEEIRETKEVITYKAYCRETGEEL